MRTSYLTILLVFGFTSAVAAPTWHTSTIRSVYPLANGDVVLTFNEDAPTCTNASNPKYYYIRVGENGMTLDGIKMLMSTALAAASMGRPITINFDNASSGCFVNRLLARFD